MPSRLSRCYSCVIYRSSTQITETETQRSQTDRQAVKAREQRTTAASLHVPLQKLTVEITSDSVVDETFRCLGLSTSLVLEYNIIIPPAEKKNRIEISSSSVLILAKHVIQHDELCVNLLLTLKDPALLILIRGFPRISSASFILASSSACWRS